MEDCSCFSEKNKTEVHILKKIEMCSQHFKSGKYKLKKIIAKGLFVHHNYPLADAFTII